MGGGGTKDLVRSLYQDIKFVLKRVGDVRNVVNFLRKKKDGRFSELPRSMMLVFDSSVNSTSLVECLPAATSVQHFVCLLCSALYGLC